MHRDAKRYGATTRYPHRNDGHKKSFSSSGTNEKRRPEAAFRYLRRRSINDRK
jgi:hypothetical protein